jgi:dTDP-4-dehydrorhamnose 3,5-epimerase-like enzyme
VEKDVSISGVVIFELEWKDGRLVVLQENDHILRRFGQVDVVKMPEGSSLVTHRGGGADEVWALLEGEALLKLTDRRQESPSLGQTDEFELNGNSPQAVLIPFGVQAQIFGHSRSALLRITTHADELFPKDTVFSISTRANQDG